MSYFDKFFSPFMSAYRKRSYRKHSTGSYSFVRGMEREIRQEFYCGCSFNGPMKAFDRILYDLITAKLAAYGIEREALRLIYSYLNPIQDGG